MSEKKFYLTTPIYYVNARPHIGHAYTTIVADVLARRHRLLGEDTFFLTGTDEHGQKIERSAAAAGIAPQQFADQVSKSFEDLWKRMGITNDAYIRTTDDKHKRGVQKLFAELYERGQIYLSSYTGQYSIGEEMFVEGPPGTIGPDGRPTETVTEENFFFRLSDYQLKLLNLIESNELLITPDSSRNEVLAFLRGNVASTLSDTVTNNLSSRPEAERRGDALERPADHPATTAMSAAGNPYLPGALRDLSVSRSSFTWGIPVPEPAASISKQKHVIYVWLDALANYMTAIGYGSDDPKDIAEFKHYWPADLHLVGKEITRFHCIYWPAFLLAAGIELPKAITAHGWLLFDNSKMSKSKGNIVRTETILDAFGTLCPPPASPSHSPSHSPSSSLGLSSFAESGGSASPAEPQSSSESADRKGTASEPVLSVAERMPENTSTEDGASAPEVRLASQSNRDIFASDVLRYFLLREIPFGQDGSFSFDAMITRYNADLANGYGNLISRVLSMIHKYFEGIVPDDSKAAELGLMTAVTFPSAFGQPLAEFSSHLDHSRFNAALEWISVYISGTDKNLSDRAPWKLAAAGKMDDVAANLYAAAESIRIITALLYPILPYATSKVWAQLGLGDIELAARKGELKNLQWGGLKPGTKLGPLGPIFPRADKGLAQIMTDMENPTPLKPEAEPTSTTDPAAGPRTASLNEPISTLSVGGSTAHTSGPNTTPSHTEATPSGPFGTAASQTPITAGTEGHGPADASSQITIDDFAKVELRVAQILVAERIPKADKLLRLEVDLGYEKRQILSGIAEWYAPEDLIGRRIVVITNLAPRKMRGLESHGMLLAASEENAKPFLATVPEGVPVGTRLK